METFCDVIIIILFFLGVITFLFLGRYVIMMGISMIEDGVDYKTCTTLIDDHYLDSLAIISFS